MREKTPQSKWERSVVTGKTTAQVGGKVLKYLARKPFLSQEKNAEQKKKLESDSAKRIFQSLVLLKGTALKLAQMLSLEKDLLPDELKKELEKAYNQVPPMNRVLVEKVLTNTFGRPLSEVFPVFDPNAFAAASLGQVHVAKGEGGVKLAVKVQYPGIERTIENDLHMVTTFLRPLPDFPLIKPSLAELETRLAEETDYMVEADNLRFFREHLTIEGVRIPEVYGELTKKFVLTTEFVEGVSVDQWLKKNPPQSERDEIANRIYQIFIQGFYMNRTIHADPNPGNFLISDDLEVGLVDFGCVKRFSKAFVEAHKALIQTIIHKKEKDYLSVAAKMNLISKNQNKGDWDLIFDITSKFVNWYHTLYEHEVFDFSESFEFLHDGKDLIKEFFSHKHLFSPDADFLFLDRTRYGLFKLFESMGAQVKMTNEYEC